VLIDRNDLPKHLFRIPDLDLSDDLCAEPSGRPMVQALAVQRGFRYPSPVPDRHSRLGTLSTGFKSWLEHKIRRKVEFPQHPWRQRDENSTRSQFMSHARSPDPWDQPIADTCRIFVVAWEFFSEGSLFDLNTNREHSKQDTSPEKPPPGA
jgi:hypothetical protein